MQRMQVVYSDCKHEIRTLKKQYEEVNMQKLLLEAQIKEQCSPLKHSNKLSATVDMSVETEPGDTSDQLRPIVAELKQRLIDEKLQRQIERAARKHLHDQLNVVQSELDRVRSEYSEKQDMYLSENVELVENVNYSIINYKFVWGPF